MRVIGLDIHRSFAEAAEIVDGTVRHLGRVELVRDKLVAFAKRLGADAEVVIEATGNTLAVVKLMAPHVKRVVIANPLQVRIIADAKVNLLPASKGDVFCGRGRAWLAKQPLDSDERQAIEIWLAELDRLEAELARSDEASPRPASPTIASAA